MSTGSNGVQFSSLFSADEVVCQTSAKDREDLLKELLKKLAYNRGIGNVEEAFAAVMEREEEGSTVISPGLAVPHARLDAISEIIIGVASSSAGVKYRDDSDPVKLVVLVLVPKTSPGAYIQALSSLAKLLQDPESISLIANLNTPQDIWNYFDKGRLVLPDHLTAKDIMDPVATKLSEHDTLEKAITFFVRHELNDLPVVDTEGDLIGVVSTRALLRVGLPDYILWMDDLTPIINFEPFAEIMRKEGKTWLTEIMENEYATVSEDAPAVQVAKEITRRATDRAYVVRGEKLVGVVSLQRFLSKIMRE